MILSRQDAGLFFKLVKPLQVFVNNKLDLIQKCSTIEEYQKLEMEQKIKIRDALYKNIGLIDEFISENPQQFTVEELNIIRKWHKFIAGDFFIERYLSKHAIFIRDNAVYAVAGLYDPIDRIITPDQLPARVSAVLLPFKGRIIYDGLMQTYRIFFGRGIRSDLKEIYLTAKQNGRIIETLEPEEHNEKLVKVKKPAKDWSSKVSSLLKDVQELKAGAGSPSVQGPVFGLVKASMELAQAAVDNPGDIEQLWSGINKVSKALKKISVTLNRAIDSE